MTAQYKHEIARVYHNDRCIVSIDFNLEDLKALLDWVPEEDGFRKDVQEGIDWIEKMGEALGG